MACPTCGEAMKGVGDYGAWCPVCGTLCPLNQQYPSAKNGTAIPKLVERCREFDKMMNSSEFDDDLWRRLGVSESIHLPANRPGGEQ